MPNRPDTRCGPDPFKPEPPKPDAVSHRTRRPSRLHPFGRTADHGERRAGRVDCEHRLPSCSRMDEIIQSLAEYLVAHIIAIILGGVLIGVPAWIVKGRRIKRLEAAEQEKDERVRSLESQMEAHQQQILMVAGLAPKSPPTHIEDSGERINRFEAEQIASESAVATILKDSYLTGSAAAAREIVAIYEEAYPGPIRRDQFEAFLVNLPSRLAYNVGEIRIGGMSKGAHGMFVTLDGPPGVGRVLGNVLRHAPESE